MAAGGRSSEKRQKHLTAHTGLPWLGVQQQDRSLGEDRRKDGPGRTDFRTVQRHCWEGRGGSDASVQGRLQSNAAAAAAAVDADGSEDGARRTAAAESRVAEQRRWRADLALLEAGPASVVAAAAETAAKDVPATPLVAATAAGHQEVEGLLPPR